MCVRKETMERKAVESPHSNSLLDRFPPGTVGKLDLEPVTLRSHDVLAKADERCKWLYFPHRGAVVSLTRGTSAGTTVEVGIIGAEGVVGFQYLLAARPMGSDSVVQVSGDGSRARIEVMQSLFDSNTAVRKLLLDRSMTFLNQVSQHAVCNRVHSIEQRLAKWILAVRDRIESDELDLTHDFLAQMLGIRRPGVTLTIGALTLDGLVTHERGVIRIRDREGLVARACECYELIREHDAE